MIQATTSQIVFVSIVVKRLPSTRMRLFELNSLFLIERGRPVKTSSREKEMGNRQNTAVPQNIKVFLRSQIEKKTSEPFLAYAKFQGPCRGVQIIRLSGRVKDVDVPAYILCECQVDKKGERLIQVSQYKAQITSQILIVRIEDWVFA